MTNLHNFVCGFANILQEKWQVDIQLKAGDTVDAAPISAHKLAARSNVLKTMLESDEFKGNGDIGEVETVTLSDMNQEELEAFVEFIYSYGSLSTEKLEKHVGSLYIAADKYDIPHLRDLCRDEFIKTLSKSNALDVLEISQIPFDQVLNDAAFDFISRNLRTISSSNEFNLFVRRQPDLTVKIMKAGFEFIRRNGHYGY